MILPELVWLIGGIAITVLLAAAVSFWIVQESRAQHDRPSPPPASPPAPPPASTSNDSLPPSR